jgi:hypothetical protein
MVLTINMEQFEKISLKITIINPYKIILRSKNNYWDRELLWLYNY